MISLILSKYSRRVGSYRNSIRGISVIELLIVMGIFTLLASVTLPAFRSTMNQRKTSQAAILVKNMMESARARAIANGRPVAVVLERLSSRAQRNVTTGDLESITANNAVAAFPDNYAQYNTCIRLSLAEAPPPATFDSVAFSLVGSNIQFDASIGADPRFLLLFTPGAEIEFPEVPSIGRRIELIDKPVLASGRYSISINNFDSVPLTRQTEFELLSVKRKVILPSVPETPPNVGGARPLSGLTKVLVHALPKPISSQVIDLPRGTCIDLSLSGFSNDSPLIPRNASFIPHANLRDTRRQFASDWIYADKTNGFYPSPGNLRPVYLVFNQSGVLESVLMNDTGPLTGNPELNRYQTLDDVYLFIGRNDRVLEVSGSATTTNGVLITPDNLASENIKANINDNSASWVRVSPSSGSIAIATVAAYDETAVTATTPIGQVLYQSRALSFTTQGTAQ